jgi:hypothetical protein
MSHRNSSGTRNVSVNLNVRQVNAIMDLIEDEVEEQQRVPEDHASLNAAHKALQRRLDSLDAQRKRMGEL